MKALHHIAVCVRDLDSALRVWRDGLGLELVGVEEMPARGIRMAMLHVGDVMIELLQPTSDASEVAGFMARHGEGLHHVALEVDEIDSALRQANVAGMSEVVRVAGAGAGGTRVAFLHPRSANGVLVELVETVPEMNHRT
jgi:methylmalonyl-CoA/ethylmalonyl-CoA epimerase